MKPGVHVELRRLAEGTGKEYGKLVQKLLALAFLDAGADRVTERGTQGIDLEVDLRGRSLAVEVKTAEGSAVTLGKKDIEGLAARGREGADPYVAVLGARLADHWIFARYHPGELRANQKLPLVAYRAWRDRDLEQAVIGAFDRAVEQHAGVAGARGQGALDALLLAHPSFHRA